MVVQPLEQEQARRIGVIVARILIGMMERVRVGEQGKFFHAVNLHVELSEI